MSGHLQATDHASKAVVVHRGARDGYQVARALAEAGLLEALVTDVYWPRDRAWARWVESLLPRSVRTLLRARVSPGIPSSLVRLAKPSGPLSFALDKLPKISFERRRQAQRWTDASLGTMAGELAAARGSQLLSYSYYGYHAFRAFQKPGILFQVHPHPVSVRRLLQRNWQRIPIAHRRYRKNGSYRFLKKTLHGWRKSLRWPRIFCARPRSRERR